MNRPAARPNSNRSGSDAGGLLVAVMSCLLAAGVLLAASGLDWLQASIAMEPPLPDARKSFTGGEVIDALVAIGILVGAAGLALIATRWPGRLAVGVVLIVGGLLTLAQVGFFLYDAGMQTAWSWAQDYATAGSSVLPDHQVSPAPAVVALLGGLITVNVGIFTIVRRRRWPVMGARYERRARSRADDTLPAPGTNGPEAQVDTAPVVTEAAMWSALERGEDPTATSPDPRAPEAAEPPDQPVPGR